VPPARSVGGAVLGQVFGARTDVNGETRFVSERRALIPWGKGCGSFPAPLFYSFPGAALIRHTRRGRPSLPAREITRDSEVIAVRGRLSAGPSKGCRLSRRPRKTLTPPGIARRFGRSHQKARGTLPRCPALRTGAPLPCLRTERARRVRGRLDRALSMRGAYVRGELLRNFTAPSTLSVRALFTLRWTLGEAIRQGAQDLHRGGVRLLKQRPPRSRMMESGHRVWFTALPRKKLKSKTAIAKANRTPNRTRYDCPGPTRARRMKECG
jgi:hypothetical protein